MKRAIQELGIKPWYGGDLVDLQGEPLAAVEAIISGYGNYVLYGCTLSDAANSTYDISAGYVVLKNETGESRILPFAGASAVSLPIYLVESIVLESRVYDNGEVNPVTTIHSAVAVTNQPSSGEYLTFTTNVTRFVDAIQDSTHKFVNETMYNFLTDVVITTALLADSSVTTDKLATLAVTAAKIASSAVTTDKISNYAVTSDKIANLAVITAKLANLAVTEEKIAVGAVTTDKVADANITLAKLSTSIQALVNSIEDKATKDVATIITNGLMSYADKAKLDGVATGAIGDAPTDGGRYERKNGAWTSSESITESGVTYNRVLLESYESSDGTSGYRKYSDGWFIQWFVCDKFSSPATARTITFPIAFCEGGFRYAMGTIASGDGGRIWSYNPADTTHQAIKVYTRSTEDGQTNNGFAITAYGWWKDPN